MKRRVLIIRNAFQYDFGGAETYALNLAKALIEDGRYEPILVTRVDRLIGLAKNSGIKVVRGLWWSRQGDRKWYMLVEPFITVWYLLLILLLRVNVVHPQGRDDFIFASRAGSWLGKKIVWTDHGDLKYIFRSNFPGWITKKTIKALRVVDKVIIVSRSELEEIRAVHKDVSKFTIIHNGVFLNNGEHLDSGEIIIGSTSRLVTTKGIGELIEAFSQVPTKYNARLWIVGDGPEVGKFKSMATKLDIYKSIKFFGYREDVPALLHKMDIFVHPSYHEAFCLSIIEAAMAGLPIIATNVGGNPEIVDKDIGVLVPIKDTKALTLALLRLINNKNMRQKMGKNAHQKAIDKFDFQKIVSDQIIKLYGNKI